MWALIWGFLGNRAASQKPHLLIYNVIYSPLYFSLHQDMLKTFKPSYALKLGSMLVSFTNPLAAGSGLVERTPKKVRFSLGTPVVKKKMHRKW